MKLRTALTLLQFYLVSLGVGLLLQGLLTVLFRILNLERPFYLRTDPLHASIHIAWGLALLYLVFCHSSHTDTTSPPKTQTALVSAAQKRIWIRAGLSFAIFFETLGILGVLVHHPLGMVLGRIENVFHLVAGTIALILTMQVIKA
jgi:hypothetical protein